MAADLFAAMFFEEDGACVGYSFHPNNPGTPFDIAALTPSPSQSSTSPLGLSDQDSFHTPSPSQLIPSQLDLACDQDPFNRQLFEALFSPANTPSPTRPSDAPLSESLLQLDQITESDLDLSHQDFTSLTLQDMEMAEAIIETTQEPTTPTKRTIDKEWPSVEKKSLSRPPGATKRHSVSRQAQQPPLVTHQHHTSPPFVSPLIQSPHHPHQHRHHKSGSSLPKLGLIDACNLQHGEMNEHQQTPSSSQLQNQQDLQQQPPSSDPQHLPSPLQLDTNAMGCSAGPMRIQSVVKRRLTKDKIAKNDREEVWPLDVEKVFYEALEVIPKLGRRKVLVDGKPCGRNELIADYLFKRTNKIRTRKQVSSHIQVLKNTRKNDAAFMKLLLDSGEGDDDLTIDIPSGYYSAGDTPEASPTSPLSPMGYGLMDQRQKSTTSIPSFGLQLYQLTACQTQPMTKKHRHTQSLSSIMSDITSPLNCSFTGRPVYQHSGATPDSAVSLSADMGWKNTLPTISSSLEDGVLELTVPGPRNCSSTPGREDSIMSDLTNEITYPFWPNAFGLFTEYVSDLSPGLLQIRSLARSRDLGQKSFGSINVHQLPQEKFPTLHDLYQKTMCTFLYFKIKLDLNLSLHGVFGNTSLFDSTEHRLVECTTLIYSFGCKVLEAKEHRQATVVDNKCVYNFEFVNQFFDAFLSGIRSLKTSGEVDIALTNLSVVQVFEDKDARFESPAPLLVMVFDFELGQGDIETYFIADGSDMLEALVC